MSARQSPRPAWSYLRSVIWAGALLLPLPGTVLGQVPAPAVSSDRPLHLGGYAGAVLNTTSLGDWEKARVSEISASALVSGTLWDRVAYFGELDGRSRSEENYARLETERRLDIVRLYGEYGFSDRLRVRVGRFLTPIGEWNEVHAEPLTWTSIRPLTTYRSFAKSVTGILIAGEAPVRSRYLGYALYAGRSTGGGDEHEVRFDDALGGRIALEVRDSWWLGASAVALRERRPRVDTDGDAGQEPGVGDADEGGEIDHDADDVSDIARRGLLGLDTRVTVHGIELTSEATLLSPLGLERAEWGVFGQAAVPIVGSLWGVARIERFTPRAGTAGTTGTLGMVFRPRSWMTLKSERQIAPTDLARVANGWFVSASILF